MLEFKKIEQLELELPYLLRKPEIWQSLFINYEKPFVERVWCSWNEHRVNLHRILPCDPLECFFHPHPWPSIVKVVEGSYCMLVGYGTGLVEPPTAMSCLMVAGSMYAMTHIDSWHSVYPIDNMPVWSLMLTEKPWGREMPKANSIKLSVLQDEKFHNILDFFGTKYPL